ncbi:MAG: alpha,alpha-trehalase TreF [Gammaproteobacteria bacterium]|nr:alpha,alpha-trehalase TreF [Gammaproteobacteria bacterium]
MPVSKTPREIYGELFEAVQGGHIFADSKTFVDSVPKNAPAEVIGRFMNERDRDNFDLKAFVLRNFDLPDSKHEVAAAPAAANVQLQIENLWEKLTRAPDLRERHSSLIELPKPYVVPGGRFREMYYWDSYFTMLGLAASGRVQMVRDMVDNFAYLVDRIGFIPNGTRSYYCTRSQPPFFVLMIELLAVVTGDDTVRIRYFPQLRKEYDFWMAGAGELGHGRNAIRRVVRVGDALLNRYWDDSDQPRQESFAEDLALAARCDRNPTDLYRDVRAACESGWDFSSRWLLVPDSIATIRTSDIVPVDLNSIMHRLESVLSEISAQTGDRATADLYLGRAEKRKAAIQGIFYDGQRNLFVDLVVPGWGPSGVLSLAGAYPLFFGLATVEQAEAVAARLRNDFLRQGGWVTTLQATGQQWDSPNGWAPLQWIVFEGLRHYGFDDDAISGARRWVDTNVSTFERSGRFMEKYDVEDPGLTASGGEYSVQDGFGWTNGVLLSLLKHIR